MVELQNSEKIVKLENEGFLVHCKEVIYNPNTSTCILTDVEGKETCYYVTYAEKRYSNDVYEKIPTNTLYVLELEETIQCVLDNTRLTILL